MRRREFIGLLGGAAAAWPLTAHGQQAGKLPIIGVLGATPSAQGAWIAAFVQRLHELGWIEGRNLAIEYRWSQGDNERASEIAVEFVRLQVAVIVSPGTPASIAAKRATSTIPIVFLGLTDPVDAGLAASLARPGGNATGLSNQNADIASKRVQLLREVSRGMRRLAILGNVDNPANVEEIDFVRRAARTLGLDPLTLEIRRAQEIASVFEGLKDRVEALYVCLDPLLNSNRIRINTLVLAARLPTMYDVRDFVEVGGLMSYGPNPSSLFRRGADFVDKILRGTQPADIPVEQPTKFDLVINRTTAKTLGLTIPESLLALADEVIE